MIKYRMFRSVINIVVNQNNLANAVKFYYGVKEIQEWLIAPHGWNNKTNHFSLIITGLLFWTGIEPALFASNANALPLSDHKVFCCNNP